VEAAMALHVDPENWSFFVLSVLAGWRLARLLHSDEGPFGLMVIVRRGLYRLRLGPVVDCFDCGAVWIAIGLAVVVFESDRRSILLAVALAGAISLLERYLERATDGTVT
jgi:hypothetical protein